ncbi:MAG: deaminase, partial [Mucinivorans sp.]
LGGKYLSGCTIYVTVEPCPMCASALRWAQVDRVVWGAKDIKRGFTTISDKLLHPKTTTNNGVLELECAELMTNFFAQLRK